VAQGGVGFASAAGRQGGGGRKDFVVVDDVVLFRVTSEPLVVLCDGTPRSLGHFLGHSSQAPVLWHNKPPPQTATHIPRRPRVQAGAAPGGALMSTTTPPLAPGGGPEPAPPAFSLSGGGGDEDHDFSPLLDVLQRFPGIFHEEVLERLDPTARAALAASGSTFRETVYPRPICPVGLLRAQTTGWGVVQLVFKPPKPLGFLGSVEQLARAYYASGCFWDVRTCLPRRSGRAHEAMQWAREHDCPWDSRTCEFAARGGHLGVGVGALLPVDGGEHARRGASGGVSDR
jgi:hypothetical protein